MEASTAAPNGAPDPTVPPAPPAPPAPPTGDGGQTEPLAETQTPSDKNAKRSYGVFTELALDVSSAAARREAAEKLQAFGDDDGNVTVLVLVGRAQGKDPRSGIIDLGQTKPLDGDYKVIADGTINTFNNVKTAQKVDVQIG